MRVILIVLIFFNSLTILAQNGHIDFMNVTELNALKSVLPSVSNPKIDSILKSNRTIWYDEKSMVFGYQDSVEVVVGFRANSVGRETGEANRNNPDISRLLNYFGPDKKFNYPFRTAAGTDDSDNVKVINFWSPPIGVDSKPLPVKWWKASNRGRWHWVFPIGTIFGEVLYTQGTDKKWYVFEIRVRERYSNGWNVDLFRPFTSSQKLADAIKKLRPNWETNSELKAMISQIQNPSTLKNASLEPGTFHLAIEKINGSLDFLPEFNDESLAKDLLTKFTFESAEGRIWKENGRQETYAPTTTSNKLSIVPKNYKMGLIPVNEVSCSRCHNQTGRGLGDFDGRIVLYGEIWGEDQIFTWHLFQPNPRIYGTFDDRDGSRIINPKLFEAGLLKNEKPSVNDPLYKPLKIWPLFN